MEDIFQSVMNFIVVGCEPGSFTRYLIQERYKDALLSAHPSLNVNNIKTIIKMNETIIPYRFFEDDEFYRNWIKNDGFINSPKEFKVPFTLTWSPWNSFANDPSPVTLSKCQEILNEFGY